MVSRGEIFTPCPNSNPKLLPDKLEFPSKAAFPGRGPDVSLQENPGVVDDFRQASRDLSPLQYIGILVSPGKSHGGRLDLGHETLRILAENRNECFLGEPMKKMLTG